MMILRHGNVFRITGPLWGEPPVTGGFPSQTVFRRFDVTFDANMNKLFNNIRVAGVDIF